MIDDARYVRQVLLPEIGREGQARIGRWAARLGGDTPAHDVAVRYALAAGFPVVVAGGVEVDRLAPTDVVVDPAARAVLAGARAALAEIRCALAGTAARGAGVLP